MYLTLCHFLRWLRSGATKVLSMGYLTPYVVSSLVMTEASDEMVCSEKAVIAGQLNFSEFDHNGTIAEIIAFIAEKR